MRKLAEVRSDKGNFDLYEADQVVSVFADGLASMQFGLINTKLDFFVNEPTEMPKDGKPQIVGALERRVVNTRLTVPTVQLLGLMQTLIDQLAPQRDQVATSFETTGKEFVAIIDRFSKKP